MFSLLIVCAFLDKEVLGGQLCFHLGLIVVAGGGKVGLPFWSIVKYLNNS